MPLIRINEEELYKEVKYQAEKHDQSIAQFTEEALKKLVDEKGYDYDSLLELVKNSTFLSLYLNIIKKEFDGAPRSLIRDVVKLIKRNVITRFYKIILDDENHIEKLKEIFSSQYNKDIVMVAKIKPEKDYEKEIDKIVDTISNLEKGPGRKKNVNIKMTLRNDSSIRDKPELLIFISDKKEKINQEENKDDAEPKEN